MKLLVACVASVIHELFEVLASPVRLDQEYVLTQLTDGIARALSGLSRTEAHELQDIEQIPDTYQKLYKCATLGMKDRFLSIVKDETNEDALFLILSQLSPLNNTFLHVAVSFGHQNLASEIVRLHKPLLSKQNLQGDTALHIAARAGNYNMLKCLVDLAKDATDIEDEDRRLFGIKNKEENTALHEALILGHQSMAHCLMEADPLVSFYANKEHKSPLYLAAEAGFTWVNFRQLLNSRGLLISDLMVEGKSPLHAAILGQKKEVLMYILNNGFAIDLKDEKGRTPLHYAASTGYLEGVRIFLKSKCSFDSCQPNDNGTFPVHSASSKDHVDIVQELLQHCPASKELLNSDDQNIVHVAAKYGKYNIVKYFIRKGDEFQMLINQKDKDGNTPLHLATIHRHPRVVKYLTWNKLTNLKLLNNKGMTALDVAESTMEAISSFHGRLTWVALKSAGAERAHPLHVLQRKNGKTSPEAVAGDQDGDVTKKSTDVAEIINSCRAYCIKLGLPNKENYKDRVNTLLVVTTLVATVTFAAGFTMPGGYKNSDPNEGKATLLTKSMFQVFVICNVLAMYSSIFVAITLIWAQLGDIILVFTALRLVMPLLGIALTTLSLAFMAGVYVVVSDLRWLAIFVLVIGGLFLYTIMTIFIPLFFPTISPTFRYITYYPFYLVAVLASTSYNNEPDED